ASFDGFMHDLYGARVTFALEGPRTYEGPRWDALRTLLDRRAPPHPERLSHPLLQRRDPVTMVIERMESLWSPIAERDAWAPPYDAIAEIRELGELTRAG